jgi:hypothetical protein
MPTAIELYKQATDEVMDAMRNAERVAGIVRHGADVLGQWKRAIVANCQGAFPPEIGMNPNAPTINASEWPSGQQIADALGRFHDARIRLKNAYQAIPDSERSVVQPPNL